jgi:hypothetical protein
MYLALLFRKNIILYTLLVYILAPISLQGQSGYKKELQVSLFNNAIAFPFSGKAGIIHAPIHPGFTLGIASRINHHPHHQLFVHAKFAYLYQKWVQHGIHLYPEFGYRYAFGSGIAIEADLGVGYMHSFSDLQQFKLNSQGEYKRVVSIGRAGLMASLAMGLSYDLQRKKNIPMRLFTQYQLWFQTPFAKSYVPVLPNAALHIGSAFYFSRRTQ